MTNESSRLTPEEYRQLVDAARAEVTKLMNDPGVVPSAPRTTREPCQVHERKHLPNPHLNHRHHVWPLAFGGPDVDENIIVVCPTGHANIHALIDLFRVHRGVVPYMTLRTFAFKEREYAQLGYDRLTRGAM